QVIAALHRVEGVPFGMVLADVAESGTDAPLRGARVRARGVELGDDRHRDVGVVRRVAGSHQARAAGANHDDIESVSPDHAVIYALPYCGGVRLRMASPISSKLKAQRVMT